MAGGGIVGSEAGWQDADSSGDALLPVRWPSSIQVWSVMKPSLLLSLVLLSLSTQTPAQTAKVLKDINTLPIPTKVQAGPIYSQGSWKGSSTFTRLGKQILLLVNHPKTGEEIYISDGTQAGTRLLKDIEPGTISSGARNAVVTQDGKHVFFTANDGKSGAELWITDGTTAGTRMVKDIYKGSGSSAPDCLVLFGKNSVVFCARSTVTVGTQVIQTGVELFISDGTSKGTRLLKDIQKGPMSSWPGYFRATRDGKKLFFSADDGTIGNELWMTDGTPAGTKLVKDIRAGWQPSYPYSPCPLGSSQIVFSAEDGSRGSELWISDGTTSGTKLVKELRPGKEYGASTFQSMALGNKVIFDGYIPGKGFEPYVTDGTSAGTLPLIDAWPGKSSGHMYRSHLDSLGKKVYWCSQVGWNDYRIFVSDGTPAGTRMFTPKNTGGWTSVVESLGKVYYQGQDVTPGTGWELCVSDGSLSGTKTLRDTRPGPSSGNAAYLTRFDASTLYYIADDGLHSNSLWQMKSGKSFRRLDLKKDKVNLSSFPVGMARFGKYVVFGATDGLSGVEPWISDGTASGTRLLKDLNPGWYGSKIRSFAALGDKLVFDSSIGPRGNELNVTDGTPAGTKRIRQIRTGSGSSPGALTSIGGKVYFAAYDAASGSEPWVTDGTPLGTMRLKDLVPGSGSSMPGDFTGYGNKVVFRAFEAAGGTELYITDGTTKGTKRLKDIAPGSRSSYPSSMAFSQGKVYFAATTSTHGTELWVTDFTTAGTKLVKDLLPGSKSSSPFELAARNGRIYFRAFTPATGNELFVSDGSPGGTRLFLDYHPGKANTFATHISAIGSRKVYFTANMIGTGAETLVTDGTVAGTTVFDINPGTGDGLGYFENRPAYRVTIGSQVLVRGFQPAIGEEIFMIDNGATAEPLGTPYGSTWIQGSDPVLGKTATITGATSLAFATHITLFGSVAARPVRFGSAGFVQFAPTRYFGLTGITRGIRFQHSLAVPNNKSLVGVQLVFQTLAFDSTNLRGTLELSNGLQWSIGK